nr:aspyridones efflux protein apdf [Quercus suber]
MANVEHSTAEPAFDDAPSDTKPESMDEEKGHDASLDHQRDDGKPMAPEPAPAAGPPGGPPPNGGAMAWLQTYYESGELFTATSSNIAWIGSIQALMVLIGGAFSGPIYDRGYLRLLLLVGSFMVVFGFMMLSLCHTFWQALLAQGFAVGIGGGCLFVPGIAIIPTYFNTKLGLAMGLAASGSSMGGIIYPIMFYKLIGEVGFPWAVRIIGFTALATLIIPVSLMKMRVKPGRVRSIIDWSAFTDWPFVIFVLACIIGFLSLYVALFYFSFFGQSTGITDASLSFYLVPILNAASVFGRTLPNILSDKIGPLNVITPGSIVVGIVLLCNLAVNSTGGIIVTVLFFGFFSGIFIALPPVLFVALTKDKTKIGTRMGMGFALIGCGVLAGGPGGGAILGNDPDNLDWTGVWIYGGVPALVTGAILAGLRIGTLAGRRLIYVHSSSVRSRYFNESLIAMDAVAFDDKHFAGEQWFGENKPAIPWCNEEPKPSSITVCVDRVDVAQAWRVTSIAFRQITTASFITHRVSSCSIFTPLDDYAYSAKANSPDEQRSLQFSTANMSALDTIKDLANPFHAYVFGTSFWYFLRGMARVISPTTVISWFRPPVDALLEANDLEIYNVWTDAFGLLALAAVLLAMADAAPLPASWTASALSSTEVPTAAKKPYARAAIVITMFHHITTGIGAWQHWRLASHHTPAMDIGVYGNIGLTLLGVLALRYIGTGAESVSAKKKLK